MKRFLRVAAVLMAAMWLASCCALHKGPCGHGPGKGPCAQCPKAADCKCAKGGECACKKGGVCTCKDCKCADCAKKAACACGKGGECKCVDCKCPHCLSKAAGASPCDKCPNAAAGGAVDAKELQHGPCGPPEGAPAK